MGNRTMAMTEELKETVRMLCKLYRMYEPEFAEKMVKEFIANNRDKIDEKFQKIILGK